MFAKYQQISSQNNSSQMRQFVEQSDVNELSKIITTRISSPGILKILNDVLEGFSSTSESSQAKRRKLVESVLQTLGTATLPSNQVDEIINRIVLDFPKYEKQHLVKLTEYCLDAIRKNNDDHKSWKDMLPILLTVLEEKKYINHMGQEVSGKEYKSLIIRSICTIPWEVCSLTPLAQMFCDMELEKEDKDTTIRALCDKISSIPLGELPPLVHQLLRLCSNQDSRLLIETLRKYFAFQYRAAQTVEEKESIDDIETVSLKDVQQTEGTVLYHIYQETQLDHTNLKDFIKFLKTVTSTPEYILEPFILSVLLLITQIYEDQVFEILKLAINRKIQEDEKYRNSAWSRSLIIDRWDLMDSVHRVIQNCNKERHYVLKGLMDLSFVLMETEQKVKDGSSPLWQIGVKILQELIKKRHDTAATVLQTITFKIVGGGLNVTQYTDCLGYMCRKITMVVLDCQAWVITLLDQLLLIPAEAALQVLYAILPLLRISPNVRDNLLLVLRKALYKRGTSNRMMAVSGSLEILKNIRSQSFDVLSQNPNTSIISSTGNSSSMSILTQVTLERSQTPRSLPSCNKSLCFEILNMLKKCFTDEYIIRRHLYEGLYDAVIKNLEVSLSVLEILMTHFKSYYEADENALPPIRFDLCTDIDGVEAVPVEPIAELIHVMQKIYSKIASGDSPVLDKFAVMLESLCKRMSRTELEHLGINDGMDLTDPTPKVQQKLQNIKFMITVYEALMSYKIGSWSAEYRNMAQQLYSLFKAYYNLVEFTKRLSKTKKGENKGKRDKEANTTTLKKQGRFASIKLPYTIMNLDILCKMLSLLYLKSVPWTSPEQSNYLRGHADLHRYFLQCCIQVIQSAKTLKDRDLLYHKSRYMKMYHKIGEILYKRAVLDLENLRNFDEQTALLALECFKELCEIMCGALSAELPEFLETISETENIDARSPESTNRHLHVLAASLKALLEQCLNEEATEDTYRNKMLIALSDTMRHLVHKIDFNIGNTKKILEWTKKLTQMEDMDVPLANTALQLLLFAEERSAEMGLTLNELCTELCGKLGAIDKEEVTVTEVYKTLREDNLVHVYNMLNTALREKLNNVDWILARLKAEQTLAALPDSDADTRREQMKEKERNFCRQVSHIIQMLYTLSNTIIEPGQSTDYMFKNLQHLYNLLNMLTKYFHSKSTPQNPAFQASKFVQVIQLAGKPLKSAFYNLVSYVESNQNKSKTKVKTDSYAQRNRVLKETKVIPRVVYEIEQFNKAILLLSKKTGVPLEIHIIKSVTRDFRISNTQLAESLEKTVLNTQSTTMEDVSRLEESNVYDTEITDTDNDFSPPTKKQKQSSHM